MIQSIIMIMRNDLAQVQNILDYRFSEFENLELALTAAGADEANHDGNRRMAQMGEKLIEFLLAEAAYAAGASRGALCISYSIYRFTDRLKLTSMKTLLLLLQESIVRISPRL